MIVTDKNLLTSKCEPCETIKEGEEIATKLLKELTKSQSGIGLAANQIGINKRVCVINVIEPVILINPRIMEKLIQLKDVYLFQENRLEQKDLNI